MKPSIAPSQPSLNPSNMRPVIVVGKLSTSSYPTSLSGAQTIRLQIHTPDVETVDSFLAAAAIIESKVKKNGMDSIIMDSTLGAKNASINKIAVVNSPTLSPSISIEPTFSREPTVATTPPTTLTPTALYTQSPIISLAPSAVTTSTPTNTNASLRPTFLPSSVAPSSRRRFLQIEEDSPSDAPTRRPSSRPTSVDTYCGMSGQRAGLIAQFGQTDVHNIPFGKEIEISFSVARSGLCHTYSNIEVQLVSTCEQASSNSYKYQYDIITGADKVQRIDYSKLVGPDSVSSNFSVTWSAEKAVVPGGRRLDMESPMLVSLTKEELRSIADSARKHVKSYVDSLQIQLSELLARDHQANQNSYERTSEGRESTKNSNADSAEIPLHSDRPQVETKGYPMSEEISDGAKEQMVSLQTQIGALLERHAQMAADQQAQMTAVLERQAQMAAEHQAQMAMVLERQSQLFRFLMIVGLGLLLFYFLRAAMISNFPWKNDSKRLAVSEVLNSRPATEPTITSNRV